MKAKHGLIDLSSVIWTALQAGRDGEFGRYHEHEGKQVLVNSAGYGYDNALNTITAFMRDANLTPRQLILVPEGMNSKAGRQFIHAEYKVGRERHPAQYEQFQTCREMVIQALLNVGAQVCWQDNGVEADDVIGYLAQNLDGERWILSGDKDLAQLVSDDVHHWRAGVVDQNPFAPFAHRLIPVWIALVGDSGDKIPGARGFGQKAGEELLLRFGDDGLEMMETLIQRKQLAKLVEDVGEMKALQKILDSADSVYMSYELGRLHVEKINTVRRPLQWRVGMVKPRAQIQDERLRQHGGVNRILSAENFERTLDWCRVQIAASPYVTLDVESSTCDESDEWLASMDKEDKVDVFGQTLTSLQLTFGPNMQYTVYLPVDNVEEQDVTNLTVAQVAQFLDMVPREMWTIVHNASFELPVCYEAWGQLWSDDLEYHGFLRNVRDSAIMSSYADENFSRGLKDISKRLLGYDQMTYDQVTQREVKLSEWDGRGREVARWRTQVTDSRATGVFDENGNEIFDVVEVEGDEMIRVQLRMNQLTAREVLSYGADDTICTAAAANHFLAIMAIEKTAYAFHEVETFPAYLTALAFVQGTKFSQETMREQEKEDDEAYDKAWPVLRQYLIDIGFEGTICPVFEEMTPAAVKEAFQIVAEFPLTTQIRTASKLAKLIEQQATEADESGGSDEDVVNDMRQLAVAVAAGDVVAMNDLVKRRFKGEPVLDLASPKQMTTLLYDRMKAPVRCINDVTPIQAKEIAGLDNAIRKFKKIRAGGDGTLTDAELALVRIKAKADDTAIDLALAFDAEVLEDSAKAALKAIGVMKKVMTRRSLFYKTYKKVPHWKDGLIHASANQCAAVTRRYSMSTPNLQQLPKKGEGVKFRRNFLPHRKNAVVVSIDYVGQELRLAADRSQDRNMLACYVGDKLKDIHSITAAGAMVMKWGKDLVDDLHAAHGADLARDEEGTYELFLRLRGIGKAAPIGKKADDLRKDSKNVNFGAQNGAKAVKLAETLIMSVADAQLFLDARSAMFPGVDEAAERAAAEARRTGYALTYMGARRHLAAAMNSDERGAADRAARQAWNFEIQGSAGEMTKLGMTSLWKSGVYFRYDARFIAPIHDELASSVVAEHAVDFIREKHACMAQPYSTMKVPVLGSISIGPNFADQHECGDWFIEANVKAALNDIFNEKAAA